MTKDQSGDKCTVADCLISARHEKDAIPVLEHYGVKLFRGRVPQPKARPRPRSRHGKGKGKGHV